MRFSPRRSLRADHDLESNRGFGAWGAVLAIGMIFTVAGPSGCASNKKVEEEPRPEGTGTIEVVIDDVKKEKGQLLVSLFLSSEGFPNDPDKAFRSEVLKVDRKKFTIVFEDVPAGNFAISAFHDTDEDFELDKGMFGIPSELWGVSKDAQGFMGPPSFGQARLELAPGERKTVPVPLG